MAAAVRFFRARVPALGDWGIIHLLVRDDAGRTVEECASEVVDAGFLAFRRTASPLHELSGPAELTEIDEATFNSTRGLVIPFNEKSGLKFWWLK